MISCKRAAELITQSLETPLSWRQRLLLRLHLGLCDMCRRFLRQMHLIQQAGQTAGNADPPAPCIPEATLPEPARQRIRQALQQAADSGPKG